MTSHLYHDVLEVGSARGEDLADMLAGYHYDYREQKWRRGHDHAHLVGTSWSDADIAPLAFCGADYATCSAGKQTWSDLAAELAAERKRK